MAKRGKLLGFETVADIHRPLRIKKYKYLYLVVCEDENTEKAYFKSFTSRIPKETIYFETIGTGLNPLGVVERAVQERNKLTGLTGRGVDRVWVVFDKDDADLNAATIKRFELAFVLGRAENFEFAFSNEVFELWLLLHLISIDPAEPLPRNTVYQMLEASVRSFPGYEDFVYVHGNASILEKIALLGDEQEAINRAEALVLAQADKALIKQNPVTFVHKLVLDLYAWINYFSYAG